MALHMTEVVCVMCNVSWSWVCYILFSMWKSKDIYMSYQVPLNLVFCTNVVKHYLLHLICCILKAFTLNDCRHLMLLSLKQGKGQPRTSASFGFPLPSPDCTCILYLGGTCMCHRSTWGNISCSQVQWLFTKSSKNWMCFFLMLLLFIFCGGIFPICFIPSKSKHESFKELRFNSCVSKFVSHFSYPVSVSPSLTQNDLVVILADVYNLLGDDSIFK